MSDINSLVSDAIANAGIALPSSSSQFNLDNTSLNIPSTSSSSSTGSLSTLGLGASLSGLTSEASALYGSAVSQVNQFTSALGAGGSAISNILGGFGVSTSSSASSDAADFRVRIRAQTPARQKVYGAAGSTNLLNILYDTNGMFFPYTPTISWNQAVEYDTMHFVHSNQDFMAYKSTPSTAIDVSGQFTVQNQREGEYLIACMHLLRTVSKMYFGQQNTALAGMPPPVLWFSGYGTYMFNDLPVIVKSHSYSLDNTVDYVTINVAGGSVRLPSIITIQVQLVVQHTPTDMRTKFDLDQFRTGALLRSSKGWI